MKHIFSKDDLLNERVTTLYVEKPQLHRDVQIVKIVGLNRKLFRNESIFKKITKCDSLNERVTTLFVEKPRLHRVF